MISFNQLIKNTKKTQRDNQLLKVSLLGDSSTQLLSKAIIGYGYEYGFRVDFFEAEYNQIDIQIFNADSEFYEVNEDFIIISETCQKLVKEFYQQSLEERKIFAENKIDRIKRLFSQILEYKQPKGLIYFNFQEEDDSVFGNFANKTEYSFLFQIRKLNYLLMEFAISNPSFHILDYKLLHQRFGDKASFSASSYVNNDMTLNLDILPFVAKNCIDIIASQIGVFKKCLILDLDNTMWGGVIGDDGIENIQIGTLGIGKAFTNFQLWIKELKERGIILAVCSKNYEDVAKRVFEEHPEMIIKLDDISIFVANWDNKADNIRYIQSVLNIGFDSMVFLDDNKFERELVKKNIPQLTVPELSEDPAEYVQYLKSLNLFETATFVQNDSHRTVQYQEESKRKKDEIKYSNQDDFLKDLQMEAEVSSFNDFNLPRITQLIQRSNQFNLRTVRYSEKELEILSKSDKHICLAVSLKDKYGDYGLVSVIIVEIKETSFFINTWVMSCRVLKRGMENFIINYLVNLVSSHPETNKLIGEYIPTKKNTFVKGLYSELGFMKKFGLWELERKNISTKKCFINETNEIK